MTHQEVLKYALAGPPFLSEVTDHLDACPRCRSEREALQALEARLAAAAVPAQVPPRLEARVLERLGDPPPRTGWTRGSVAAALLLTAALVGAWAGRAPAVSRPQTLAEAPVSAESVSWSAPEDSTAVLLRALDSDTGALANISAEEVQEYLSPSGQGGWNG